MMPRLGLLLRLKYAELVKSIARLTTRKMKATKIPKKFDIDDWTHNMVEECEIKLDDVINITGWDYELMRKEIFYAVTHIRLSASMQGNRSIDEESNDK